MHDAISQFREAMLAAGLEPPKHIDPNKWHRFPGIGKPKHNTSGWCVLFPDMRGGSFGDWASGLYEIWQIKRINPLSRYERLAFKKHVSEVREIAKLERKIMHTQAAARATQILQHAAPATNKHQYLITKSITANNPLIYNGSIVLPITNLQGSITSLQFICPNGEKKLLSGGKKKGCFILVSGSIPQKPSHIIICEGWATGCSLARNQINSTVLAAIDAGNLKSVAINVRHRYPEVKITIAGDDDRNTNGNPGATKAKEAALASQSLLALPQWPDDAPIYLSDFNDLDAWLRKKGKFL